MGNNKNSYQKERLIMQFPDGSRLTFGRGAFDDWCVFMKALPSKKYAPRDVDYFAELQAFGEVYGSNEIYRDFVQIYERTSTAVEGAVLQLITLLANKYGKDSLTIQKLYAILYAGMIAEENKANAILKKRIKRLGMYQVMILKMDPAIAANFSRGKPWRELEKICIGYGF